MVDTQSRLRMYGCHYNYNPPKQPVKTAREVHQLVASYTPNRRQTIDHDCRSGYLRDFTDPQTWRAFVLGHGMKTTVQSARELHALPAVKVRPEKLLTSVGEKGSAKNQFNYPRAIAVDSIGDVYIADSMNDRVQVYNGHGVYKYTIGDRGDGVDFSEPSGIAVFPNDDLAVADRRNRRIRILAPDGSLKFDIRTKDEPFSVCCDSRYNVLVSTYSGVIEMYRRGGSFYNQFPVSATACPIVCNRFGEIIVSNVQDKKIQFYNHEGKMLHEFRPQSSMNGLACENGGIALDMDERILICDSLNHTISVYTERGILVGRHVGPVEDLGAVQACAVGPVGHLSVVEYSTNGRHCLKIFRYTDCQCHLYHKSPADE